MERTIPHETGANHDVSLVAARGAVTAFVSDTTFGILQITCHNPQTSCHRFDLPHLHRQEPRTLPRVHRKGLTARSWAQVLLGRSFLFCGNRPLTSEHPVSRDRLPGVILVSSFHCSQLLGAVAGNRCWGGNFGRDFGRLLSQVLADSFSHIDLSLAHVLIERMQAFSQRFESLLDSRLLEVRVVPLRLEKPVVRRITSFTKLASPTDNAPGPDSRSHRYGQQ